MKLRQVEKYNKAEDPKEKEKIETRPLKIFLTALDNCKPLLKVVKVSKGGITYQVPTPLSEKEREFRAIKFLISSCQEKYVDAKEKKIPLLFYERFSYELLDAFNNQVIFKINFAEKKLLCRNDLNFCSRASQSEKK